VDKLREVAGRLLYANPEFQRLLVNLGGKIIDPSQPVKAPELTPEPVKSPESAPAASVKPPEPVPDQPAKAPEPAVSEPPAPTVPKIN
jgi:hypothetical protein